MVAWGEDFRGRVCYLQPTSDPQRVNLTGILKQNHKAQTVIRGIASATDRQILNIRNFNLWLPYDNYHIIGSLRNIWDDSVCDVKQKWVLEKLSYIIYV